MDTEGFEKPPLQTLRVFCRVRDLAKVSLDVGSPAAMSQVHRLLLMQSDLSRWAWLPILTEAGGERALPVPTSRVSDAER